MSITSIFFYFVFLGFLIPLYIISFIGKPLFLVKMVYKIISFEDPIKHFKVFNFIMGICIAFGGYFKYEQISSEKELDELEKNNITDPGIIESKSRAIHSSERNFLVFLSSFLVLLIVYKLSTRHIRKGAYLDELKSKKKELDALNPQKSAIDKKND